MAAARGIAEIVGDDELREDYIIPSVFNRDVADANDRNRDRNSRRCGGLQGGAHQVVLPAIARDYRQVVR